MGLIKVWDLVKEESIDLLKPPIWRAELQDELQHHRTRINEMFYGNQQLWTGMVWLISFGGGVQMLIHTSASSDETIQIISHPVPTLEASGSPAQRKPIPPIVHPTAVNTLLSLSLSPLAEPYLLTGSGEVIRVYDISSPDEPELLSEVDSHWHDVTALRLWMRKSELTDEDGKKRAAIEPWIVSASLDGTIRKWRLQGEHDLVLGCCGC